MGKSDNIINFEEALKKKENKDKFEAALKKIAEEKSAKSDGEAIQKAAKELGFDISMEDLERNYASKQEVEDEELDAVAGGWCAYDHSCFTAWKHDKEVSKEDSCWKEYRCNTAYERDFTCTNMTVGPF
ncbi:MAG: Nif11-like leader peptide family natural product precursor [Lachnospiraceae bacterium]|nr:Nif11-like leader peptide family natural product precursor [Lachnospiraceae bacterium]